METGAPGKWRDQDLQDLLDCWEDLVLEASEMAGPCTGAPKLAPGQMLLLERGSCMRVCTLLHMILVIRSPLSAAQVMDLVNSCRKLMHMSWTPQAVCMLPAS